MPTAVFQSAALTGNYSITSNGSGYAFELPLASGSLPSSGISISSAVLNISQTYQYSSNRLAVARNEDTDANLCASFTTSGNSASSNVNEALNVTLYKTLSLYSGRDTLNVRILGAGKGSSSSDGNVMSLRSGAVIKITVTWAYTYTACGAPTSVSVSANNVAPGASVTLSWSGASAGTSNAITGYEVYRSTSSGGTYSKIATISRAATSGSTTVTAPTGSGSSYYYKVLTVGTQSGYNSGQSSAYATLTCTYSAPSAPTTMSLSATLANAGTSVTLSWSGAGGGTNNAIEGYAVYRSTSSGGTYTLLGSVASASYSVTASTTEGSSYYYKVVAVGTISGSDSALSSAYATIKTNSSPTAPSISAPVAGKTVYNSRPRVLVTVGADADSHSQALSLSGYSASTAGNLAPGKKVVMRRIAALTEPGAQSLSLLAMDTLNAASGTTSRSFSYAVLSWTDASLVANTTPVRAAHLQELRNAVDQVRAYYGLSAYAWAESLVAGTTSLAGWTSHVNEIRAAIDQIVTMVNGWDTASTTHNIYLPAWTAISVNKPTAAVMTQLREAILLL